MIDKNTFILFVSSFSFIFVLICVNGQSGLIGSECWRATDCLVYPSHCIDFRCVCWSPYIPSEDLRVCTVATGDLCHSSAVCFDSNAECSRTNYVCSCKETFVQDPDTGVCLQQLNQNCTQDGVACIDGSCENDKCQCPSGLVANTLGTKCNTALGENCLLSQECSDPHASCEGNGPCVCNDEYQQIQRDGSPLCARILAATCQVDSDCADENAICERTRQGTTTCNCRESYVRSTDMQKCLAVPLVWPGSCEDNRQCRGAFGSLSSCSSFACTCPVGHEYSENAGGCILSINMPGT